MIDSLQEALENAKKALIYFKEIQSTFDYFSGMVNQADKATGDLLHTFELKSLNSNEKCKVATQLALIRKDRRYYKDRVTALQEVLDTLSYIDTNKVGAEKSINLIANSIGRSLNKYNERECRKYLPRVIKEIP